MIDLDEKAASLPRAMRIAVMTALVLALFAFDASAQAPGSSEPERRLSLHGAAGLQVHYRGDVQSVSFGFAPTRKLTLLINAQRSFVRDDIDTFADGYAFERGGTERFISGEVRFAFLPNRRISPYVLGGAGRGGSQPNVNEFFPNENNRTIHVFYSGARALIPLGPRFDAFADMRFVMALEARTDYLGVRYPVRAGLAWRF